MSVLPPQKDFLKKMVSSHEEHYDASDEKPSVCAARRRPESCELSEAKMRPSGLSETMGRRLSMSRRGTSCHLYIVLALALYLLPAALGKEQILSAKEEKEIAQLTSLEKVLQMEEDTVDKLEAMRFQRGRMHSLGDAGNLSISSENPSWTKFDTASHDCSDVDLLSTEEDPYGACDYVKDKCR
jgi:hypothetical protein